jgi:hypothetical protein
MKTLLVQHYAGAALRVAHRGVQGPPQASLQPGVHTRYSFPTTLACVAQWLHVVGKTEHSVGTASCWHSTDVS